MPRRATKRRVRSTTQQEFKLASSNLRLLLRYQQRVGRNVGHFHSWDWHGTQYFWNERTSNIIATLRREGSHTPFARIRAASYYAGIMENFFANSHFVTITSSNVGRRSRRVERSINRGELPRDEALVKLKRFLDIPHLYDGLTQLSIGRRTAARGPEIPEPSRSASLELIAERWDIDYNNNPNWLETLRSIISRELPRHENEVNRRRLEQQVVRPDQLSAATLRYQQAVQVLEAARSDLETVLWHQRGSQAARMTYSSTPGSLWMDTSIMQDSQAFRTVATGNTLSEATITDAVNAMQGLNDGTASQTDEAPEVDLFDQGLDGGPDLP